MSKEQVEKKLRPYHETVKDAIRRSANEGLSDLALVKREVAGSGGIVKLEELATEAEGLHSLLSNRQLGDPVWLPRFREQVYRLHKLLSRLV